MGPFWRRRRQKPRDPGPDAAGPGTSLPVLYRPAGDVVPRGGRRTAGHCNREMDIIGFRDDEPSGRSAYGISAAGRIHMALFGQPGAGKSSILKLLIVQNIQRGQGFIVLDPHGELARDILSVIPDGRMDDVIYINPASLYRFQRTIKINPLEVKHENDRYLVVMDFVNSLYNLYRGSWGPRLETVLRNAANAAVETEYNTLSSISAMITDKHSRDMILNGVASKQVKHFWREIFEKQYAKDAGSAAYNKIDKILTTPAVAAMLDSPKSGFDMGEAMRKNRMIIVDLSTGTSDDVASFLGTVILQMVHTEAKRRMDVDDGDTVRRSPFYIYADECHLFSNDTMAEMLRSLRKFGAKMTLATQTVNAYDPQFATEIPGVCSTLMCGRCDDNTSRMLGNNMPISTRELARLPNHMFAFSTSEHSGDVYGIVKARPVPHPDQRRKDWMEVARHSLGIYGEKVNVSQYIPKSKSALTLMSPLETAILHTLHFERRDMSKEEIIEKMRRRFEVEARDVAQALVNGLVNRLQYASVHNVKDDDGDGRLETRYSVSRVAYSSYLSQAAQGRRAGGELHVAAIMYMMDHMMSMGNYCIPDLGERDDSAADLLVVEPETYQSKGVTYRDPNIWNEKTMLAIEVETDPSKHWDQAVKNYTKNSDYGYNVWFVTFDAAHKEGLVRHLADAGVPRDNYHVDVWDGGWFGDHGVRDGTFPDIPYLRAQEVGTGAAGAGPASAPVERDGEPGPGVKLTHLEAVIYENLNDGHVYSPSQLHEKLGLGSQYSEADVVDAVRHMFRLGVIKYGSAEKRTRRTMFDGSGERRNTKRVVLVEGKADAPDVREGARRLADKYDPGKEEAPHFPEHAGIISRDEWEHDPSADPGRGSDGPPAARETVREKMDYGSMSVDLLLAMLADVGYTHDSKEIIEELRKKGVDSVSDYF